MAGNVCRCKGHAAADNFKPEAEVNIPAVSHGRAQLAGILKYRGLDGEAEVAAQLVRIEYLISTIQTSLDDLEESMADLLVPNARAGQGKWG